MPRPVKRAKKPVAKKATRLREAAKQVAVDANEVRQDVGKLLLSLEDLSVEALKEVSDRALALIAEKAGVDKQSMIGAMMGGALSVGQSVAAMFSKSKPPPKKRRARKGAGAE